MTDRELLELAAKAAGLHDLTYFDVTASGGKGMRRDELDWDNWNPLIDDGDALRLAVKLSLDINPYPKTKEVAAIQWGNSHVTHKVFERVGSDPYAATRRAITRAAAEIGKDMP